MNPERATSISVCLAFLIFPSIAFAQQQVDKPAVAVGMIADGQQPAIDGKVDDEIWKHVLPFTSFTQQEPDEGQPASELTEIRFLVDRKNLYISVIAFDREPGRIIVAQSRRDSDLNDTDSVQILLDTLNDGQSAFVFGTNPFGIEYDGQVMNEGQTSGSQGRSGGAGSQGGQVSGFNTNWVRRLDRARGHYRSRVGSGVLDSIEECALSARNR